MTEPGEVEGWSGWALWRDLAEEYRPPRIPRATCVATRHVWIELMDPNPSTEEGEGSR